MKHVFNGKTFDTEEGFMAEILKVKNERDTLDYQLSETLNKAVPAYQEEIGELKAEVEALKDDKALLTGQLQQARKHVADADLQNDALKEVIAAQESLLVAHRLGDHRRADSALTRLEKAKAKVKSNDSCPEGCGPSCPVHVPPLDSDDK